MTTHGGLFAAGNAAIEESDRVQPGKPGLPRHFQTVVNASDALDVPQGFLRHLLFKEGLDRSDDRDVIAISLKVHAAEIDVGMMNNGVVHVGSKGIDLLHGITLSNRPLRLRP